MEISRFSSELKISTNLLISILFVATLAITATDIDHLCPGKFAYGGKSIAVLLHLVHSDTGPMIITCTCVHPVEVTPGFFGHILLHAMGEAIAWIFYTWRSLSVKIGLLHHGECAPYLCSQRYGY